MIGESGQYWQGRALGHAREIERLRAELAEAKGGSMQRELADDPASLAAEVSRLRAELVECRAAKMPAPAAIVWYPKGGSTHAFDDADDAERWADERGLYHVFLPVGTWTWHPAAAPDGPAPPEEGHADG